MEKKMNLIDYMKEVYDNDYTCEEALKNLQDDTFVHGNGWLRVFHEGYGDGIYSPKEDKVVTFDEDGLPEYHSFCTYKYNPKAWVSVEDGWDEVYNGNNGDGNEALENHFTFEPIESVEQLFSEGEHKQIDWFNDKNK